MKISNAFGYALLGTCLYGAVTNSFLTDEEKGALEEIGATNEVERAGCAAALGLKTTLGLTQGEIVAAIRGVGEIGRVEVENEENGREGLESAAGETRRGTVLGRSQWGVRGAWDDDYFQAFAAGWVFPFGTNHLSGVVVYSQGGLAASSYDEPFVSLPFPVAMVPRVSSYVVERTASNSYVFAWLNVCRERVFTETLDAQIELFRNGDYCVSTNGVVVERYIRGNPYPDVPIGQDDDYRDWVDEQVGVGLENGLYKFTASFPADPIEFTLLRVGEESVVVTNAGEYVFLLEKGREYEFETIPYDPTVEYDICDDIAPAARMLMMGWWGDDGASAEWSIGGGENWLNYPGMYWWGYSPGWCCWMPTLQGSPGFTHLGPDDFPITLEAVLADYCGSETPAFQWSGSNDNVTFSNPNAQTTELNCDNLPSWDSLSLSVEANLGGYCFTSYLNPNYGRNPDPQVYVTVNGSSHVWVNRPADESNVRHFSVSILSDIPTNGTFSVSFVGSQEHVRVTPTSPWQIEVYEVNTALPGEPYVREFATVEGLAPCDDCDEEYFAWTFVTTDGVVRTGTNRFTVAQIEKVDVWSARGGESENPPPFPGQETARFRLSKNPNPDRNYPIFFCDVVDTNLVVQPYAVEYRVTTIPRNFSIPYASTTLELLDGPESGSLRNCYGKTAYYDTPSEGGVYCVDVKYGDSPPTGTVLVLPMAGASIDHVVATDLVRAEVVSSNMLSRYTTKERQSIRFGLQWFNNDGMGDYRGRVNCAIRPTPWTYNPIDDGNALGAVATLRGVPIRLAKMSNFMVGYVTTRIGVPPSRRGWSQLIGTRNDATATMSWNAGCEVASGSSFAETIASLATNMWPVADIKERRLWPNSHPTDNHTSCRRITNFNLNFCSPGFMERTP